jgi:hypothetical protein
MEDFISQELADKIWDRIIEEEDFLHLIQVPMEDVRQSFKKKKLYPVIQEKKILRISEERIIKAILKGYDLFCIIGGTAAETRFCLLMILSSQKRCLIQIDEERYEKFVGKALHTHGLKDFYTLPRSNSDPIH